MSRHPKTPRALAQQQIDAGRDRILKVLQQFELTDCSEDAYLDRANQAATALAYGAGKFVLWQLLEPTSGHTGIASQTARCLAIKACVRAWIAATSEDPRSRLITIGGMGEDEADAFLARTA